MTIALRPFRPADAVPAADAVLAGGWGAFHAQFAFYAAQPVCLGVVAADGDRIVGTAFGTQHGAIGWVGHVFVAPDQRGRGVGTRLAAAATEALEARGCRGLVLIATELGRPVYEKLGFRTEAQLHLLAGPLLDAPALGPRLRPAAPTDRAALAALDRAATGEDRTAFLDACLPRTLVLAGDGGEPRGYYARAPWGGGAAVAPDPADGLALLALKCASEPHEGRSRATLFGGNAVGRGYLAERGFAETGRVARMVRGAPPVWSPTSVWGLFSFGTG